MLETILNPEIWITGLTTMVIGMGIVFVFLVILVFAIHIMTYVVGLLNKICPVEEAVQKPKKTTNDESEIALAVAIAAVQR